MAKKKAPDYKHMPGWPKEDPFTKRPICEQCWNRAHHDPRRAAPPQSFCDCGCIENNIPNKQAAKERAAAAAARSTKDEIDVGKTAH